MKRRALITGISGQDGSYLSEILLEKDREVYGLIRRTSTNGLWRIQHLLDRIHLIPGDITDQGSLDRMVKLANPDEIYHLAAQSFVSHSFHAPIQTAQITGLGTVNLFESVRNHCPHAKVYQASSSEQFGNPDFFPQDEQTNFAPISPYGVTKTFAHQMAQVYRKAYHLFIACGIAYNHESPRRGEEFVTRKITKAVAEIKCGVERTLSLGDTAVQRDWSHARDIMNAAYRMLQQETPNDYILASGETHSVQEFYEAAFNVAGLNSDGYVVFDPTLLRPIEISRLIGYPAKAHRDLQWHTTVTFGELVAEMVQSDVEAITRSSHPVSSK